MLYLLGPPPSPQITHIEVLHNGNLHTFFNTAVSKINFVTWHMVSVVHTLQGSHRQCLIDQNPVISYTIKYFDPQTNISCGLNTVPASSCTDQICNSIWDLGAICLNSTSILVTVLATGAYGDVQESEPFMVVLRKYDNYVHDLFFTFVLL